MHFGKVRVWRHATREWKALVGPIFLVCPLAQHVLCATQTSAVTELLVVFKESWGNGPRNVVDGTPQPEQCIHLQTLTEHVCTLIPSATCS